MAVDVIYNLCSFWGNWWNNRMTGSGHTWNSFQPKLFCEVKTSHIEPISRLSSADNLCFTILQTLTCSLERYITMRQLHVPLSEYILDPVRNYRYEDVHVSTQQISWLLPSHIIPSNPSPKWGCTWLVRSCWQHFVATKLGGHKVCASVV